MYYLAWQVEEHIWKQSKRVNKEQLGKLSVNNGSIKYAIIKKTGFGQKVHREKGWEGE